MAWILNILIGVILAVILFLINFYRDPKRIIPEGNSIVSPADGKIINIINTSESSIKISKGLFGKIKTLTGDISANCYVISIFMSPLDVHINRSPIEGTVKSIKHTKGKFFEAYNLEKSLQNEKNEIIIENRKLKVKVIQIAGFLARRIRCYVNKNQKVNKGAKIGMICLGSQATLVLPSGVDLTVSLNEKVKAGSSIIAVLKDSK
ncbi:phosphatidylserine decarboxylase [Candidatus Woesearchaeota archaeon]|nr:phosphatidylserine decarboxylase [Candidatus Woesearchaeota archaeon]